MSLIDYDALVPRVTAAIDGTGRTITLVRRPSGAPVTIGGPPTGVEVTNDVKAVFVEPSSAERLGISSDNSELVKRSTEIAILPPTFDVNTYHEIEDNGVRFEITAVEELKPGDVTLLFYAGISR